MLHPLRAFLTSHRVVRSGRPTLWDLAMPIGKLGMRFKLAPPVCLSCATLQVGVAREEVAGYAGTRPHELGYRIGLT